MRIGGWRADSVGDYLAAAGDLLMVIGKRSSGFKAGTAGVGMFSRHSYGETAEPPAMPTPIDAAKILFE